MVLGSVLLASCVGQSVEVPEAQPNIAPRACPSPQPDRRTFTAPQGGCLPATALAEYTCGSDATPMMVRFAAGTNERRYLGGSYRVPVDRLPGDARRIAVWGGRTQVFARRGDPAWLWVKDAEGLMRWLAIPRRASWSVSSPSPVATASASGSTDPSSAFFIGDSITDGASTFIASALPGWTVGFDAVIGRSSISGVDPVRAQAALDPPPDVVVVELGTNDQDVATFQRDVASILSATSGIPLVLWQTVHGPTPTRPRVNAAIRQGVAGTTNAALADWNAFVRKDQLSSDGIHPASDHEDLMALLVAPLLDDWRAAVQGEGPAACIGGTG